MLNKLYQLVCIINGRIYLLALLKIHEQLQKGMQGEIPESENFFQLYSYLEFSFNYANDSKFVEDYNEVMSRLRLKNISTERCRLGRVKETFLNKKYSIGFNKSMERLEESITNCLKDSHKRRLEILTRG